MTLVVVPNSICRMISTPFSGGSRIFLRGRQLPMWVYQPIILQTFCRKLHENERIWTGEGVRVPGPPWIRQCLCFSGFGRHQFQWFIKHQRPRNLTYLNCGESQTEHLQFFRSHTRGLSKLLLPTNAGGNMETGFPCFSIRSTTFSILFLITDKIKMYLTHSSTIWIYNTFSCACFWLL